MILGRGFERSDMRVLLDRPTEHCLEELEKIEWMEPTRTNIISSMRWLVDGAKAGDQLFFHYSGHGGQVPDQDGDEADGQDETIIPVDWEGDIKGQIVDDDMWKIMLSTLNPLCRFVAVFDCCNSGTVLDLQFGVSESRPSSACTGGSTKPTIQQDVEIMNSGRLGIQAHSHGIVMRTRPLSGVMDLQNIYLATTANRLFNVLPRGVAKQAQDLPAIVKPKPTHKGKKRNRSLSQVGHIDRKVEAYVVCWSACSDGELAYGDRFGGAMVEAFINCLNDFQARSIPLTYTNILEDLRVRLHGYWKKNPADNQERQQFPQLSSSHQLDLDDIFEF
jgi:hypothetical protein